MEAGFRGTNDNAVMLMARKSPEVGNLFLSTSKWDREIRDEIPSRHLSKRRDGNRCYSDEIAFFLGDNQDLARVAENHRAD